MDVLQVLRSMSRFGMLSSDVSQSSANTGGMLVSRLFSYAGPVGIMHVNYSLENVPTLQDFINDTLGFAQQENPVNEMINIPTSEISDQAVKEGETCCICCDILEKECIVTECPKCNKSIHNECLTKWLEKQSTCPLCKFDYNTLDRSVSSSESIECYSDDESPPPLTSYATIDSDGIEYYSDDESPLPLTSYVHAEEPCFESDITYIVEVTNMSRSDAYFRYITNGHDVNLSILSFYDE